MNIELEKKIDKAVHAGVKPEDLQHFIDEEPLVNTFFDKDKILTADFVCDPDHPDLFVNPHRASFTSYWKIAEDKNHVKIIGIAWNNRLIARKFHALILSPDQSGI